jgi:protein-S-isoprenylcysteine O-methyltransferase Ste14
LFLFSMFKHFLFFITLLHLLPLLIASSLVMHIMLGMFIPFFLFFLVLVWEQKQKGKVRGKKKE